MKKNNLYIGLLYMALGALCLAFALDSEVRRQPIRHLLLWKNTV